MKREKFNLERRNAAQAGKLALALYYEDRRGYENVHVLPGTERFDMRTIIDGTYEIVLSSVTSGMVKISLEGMETAGDAIRAFDDGKNVPNEFVCSSECNYTHFAIVYPQDKSVKISTLA